MQVDRYSQTIAFLKVVLPLLALSLLSTLFLISRAVKPTTTIPFADNEIQERLTSQQITGPYFSGTSASGDQITFIAEKLTTPNGLTGSNSAQEVLVQVDMAGGRQIMLEADHAILDIADDRSELTGNVEIITSDGYQLRSEFLEIALSDVEILSPDRITGTTPAGDIEAGSMRLFAPDDGSNTQMFFTNGVKLLYQP